MTAHNLGQFLRPVPPGWHVIIDGRDSEPPGIACVSIDDLRVIASVNLQKDNKTWLHVSMTRHAELPSYEDMVKVKRLFIGDHVTAYQVFPPADRHVNHHEYCLHLWHCVDGPVTPDFRLADGMI